MPVTTRTPTGALTTPAPRSRRGFAIALAAAVAVTGLVAAVAGEADATPTSPPPGVELVPIDGGADYFSQWENSFPTEPSFFPIGVWNETLAELSWVRQYRDLGINTFVGLYNGATTAMLDEIRSQGMYAILGASGPSTDPGSVMAARHFADEPDGIYVCSWVESFLQPLCTGVVGQYTDATAVAAMSDEVQRRDPTRPVFNQYTKPVALPWYWSPHDRNDLEIYATAGDITSFDYYPVSDPWTPGEVWDLYTATRHVRELADYSRPVWVFIETSYIFPETWGNRQSPTPQQIQAEVWQAIIGGARGIEYFNHNFYEQDPSQPPTQHLLIEPAYAEVASAVKQVNERVNRLAPVINAPFARGAVVSDPGVNVMAKFHDGALYVFAAIAQDDSASIGFELTGVQQGTVEVLDEGRTLELVDGRFSDDFVGGTGVHVYRIDVSVEPPTTTTTVPPTTTTTVPPTTTTTVPPPVENDRPGKRWGWWKRLISFVERYALFRVW